MIPDWLVSTLKVAGFLAVLLGPLTILLLPNLGQYRTLEELFRRVTRDGKVDMLADGPIPYPRLSLPLGERTLRVVPDLPQEDEHPGSLLFEMTGPFGLPRIEVRPAGAQRPVPTNLTAVPVADPYLSMYFQAVTDEPAHWEKLAGALSTRLLAVARLSVRADALPVDHPDRKTVRDSGTLALSISPEKIQLRRLDPVKDAVEMMELVDRIRELFQTVLDSQTAAAPDLKGPLCQGCGVPLASAEVNCRRCHTPYHKECWEIAGTCVQYPCSCTHAVPAGFAVVA